MSLASIDLNLLVVLDTVLAEGSVARAAKRLHVTASAVSNSLARLRVALGDPLVIRRGRGIVATPRARELGPALARALVALERAVISAPFDPRNTRQTFTLAVADAGQMVWAPRLALLLAEEMPHAVLRIVGIASLVSLGGLSGVEVDVTLGVGEKGPSLHLETLAVEESLLVGRAGHPATGKRLGRSALEGLRHVAVEMVPGKGFRDPVAASYTSAGVPRHVALVVPTFTTAAAIVAASDYVTTLPASLVRVLGPALGLRVLRGRVPPHAVTLKLGWHERTAHDPAMIAFRALVRSAVLHSVAARSVAARRLTNP